MQQRVLVVHGPPSGDFATLPLVARVLESPPFDFKTRVVTSADLVVDDAFTIHWASSRHKKTEYESTHPHQHLNHFQKSSILTRKDRLVRLLRRYSQVHGRIYSFVPTSYILPSEYSKFVREYSEEELERDEDAPRSMWICKPSDLSQGRKIFLINNIMDLVHDRQYVVQRYVDRPLTVGGYKVDLRVYVLVTSFNPLVVYVHRNGLARFATAKYDRDNMGNAFSHLTNNSINKHSDTYATKKDVIGSGCKWDFDQMKGCFRHYECTS
mgnify:CR=1 FL=1